MWTKRRDNGRKRWCIAEKREERRFAKQLVLGDAENSD